MSIIVSEPQTVIVGRFTADLTQAAGAYDLCTATNGGILIEAWSVYVETAGATFTSVKLHTNQTNDTNLVTAVEGAVAGLIAQKVLSLSNPNYPIYLASGQKILYTIVGATGTGSLTVVLRYRPVDGGAVLQ